MLDDYAQRAMIEGRLTPSRGPFNLYDFISDSNRAALLARGAIPWWAGSHLKIRFLRPLSSVLVWLDFRLFGYDAFRPHLLSLLWLFGVVFVSYALYRTTLGMRAALLATAMLALSPALSIPLVWLANRDVLITLFFGGLAISAYVRWRHERRRALGVAAGCAFALTVLTGEYALCLGGYLAAYEICLRDEGPRRRLAGLLPALLPFAAYAVAHVVLGYGTLGSGFYRNPLADPGGYLRALPKALSGLLASAWLGLDGSSTFLASGTVQGIVLLAAAGVVILAVWIGRCSASSDARAAGWFTAGSILALLPLAATEPGERILGGAVLGVSGALAVLVDKGWRALYRGQWKWSTIPYVAVAIPLLYVHCLAAPLEARRLSRDAVEEERHNEVQLSAIRRVDRGKDTVLVVRANYPSTVLWTPFFLGQSAPQRWWVLSQTFGQTAAVRTAPNVVEVSEQQGPLFTVGPNAFFRTSRLNVGQTIELPGLRATVLRVDDRGEPTAVRYAWDQPVDQTDVAWISEGQAGFSEVIPPPVGFGVRLAP